MSKLFHDIVKEIPEDNEFYYLFNTHGTLIGEGEWEEENQCFYDNENDITYNVEDLDYFMEIPTLEQMKLL